MPSTEDYQRAFEQARRRGAISESRYVAPVPISESVCPDCNQDPCECDEEQDELHGAVRRESLDVMEVLAATDPRTFAFMVACEGMNVAAVRDRDPLSKEALAEDVDAVAASINEGSGEYDDRLDQYQAALRDIGLDYGYVVS